MEYTLWVETKDESITALIRTIEAALNANGWGNIQKIEGSERITVARVIAKK